MVFVCQPILMSYLPSPRFKKTLLHSGGERGTLGRLLARSGNAIVNITITPGRARVAMVCMSGAVIVWGIVSGSRAQIGYLTSGTPLYLPTAKVNQDIAEIAKNFLLDEWWGIVTTPKFPDVHSALGPPVVR